MRPFGTEHMGADAAVEEQFGPYVVYERLGVGGMATVHRALERGIEGFERIVALKRLLPHLAADRSFIKSFVREAKLASLLNHVNIVHIFELGRVGTQYFISMEYIDGRDIRRILRHARRVTGPPPIHVSVGLLLQLCDALDYAHHKMDDAGHPLGLVHRDVSPSNVLVTSAGQVKVIDFGIAKAQSSQLRTQTGRVKGKLAYMAPEAVSGKDLDARSDLFAAGVIAHELLTARPLFASKNEYQTLMKVQRGEVMPPSTFNQGCPPELDAIVLRALARDPDDRFLHAGELRDELHAMRKQYNLQTTDRDIAAWIDRAFQLEAPPGPPPPDEAAPAARDSRHRAVKPRRSDEDEAVEIAWGHEDHNGEPVVLDDVPDVSDKLVASALGADVRLDLDDLADDIPTPQPSHRGSPELDLADRATIPRLPRPVPRGKPPTPAAPLQARPAAQPAGEPGPAARSRHDSAAPAPTVGAGVRSVMIPPRLRPITSPPRVVPSAPVAPRSASPTEPPRTLPVAMIPPRTRAATGAGALAASDQAATDLVPALAAVEQIDRAEAPPIEPAPLLSVDELAQASDTIQMPALPGSGPIVRLVEPSAAPPSDGELAAAPDTRARDDAAPASGRPPHTRLVTPATELFAEPAPDTEVPGARAFVSSSHALQRPSSSAVGTAEPAPRPTSALRRVLGTVLVIVVLGGIGVTAALYLVRGRQHAAEPRPAPAPPQQKPVASIRFAVEPAGSTITIRGMPVHAGTPWDVELAPGAHQIEIQHEGYKAWLTSIQVAAGDHRVVNVVLDPLGPVVLADATLHVASTPPGLDVALDGAVVGRTPLKLSIKPGPHTVALRRSDDELWTTKIDARASAVYELSPSLGAPPTGEASPPRADERPAGDQPPPIDAGTPDATIAPAAPAPAPADGPER